MKINLIILSGRFYATLKGGRSSTAPGRPPFANDTLIAQLSALNLACYKGQPVDLLLNDLPPGFKKMTITGSRSSRVAEILYLVYPGGPEVAIHVRKFRYMDPHLVNHSNSAQDWDSVLFGKETIAHTVIYNGATCINGCENRYK